jgi:hypothetical protein
LTLQDSIWNNKGKKTLTPLSVYYLIFWRFVSILKWPGTTNAHAWLQQNLPV